jgi:hypothetical protein
MQDDEVLGLIPQGNSGLLAAEWGLVPSFFETISQLKRTEFLNF